MKGVKLAHADSFRSFASKGTFYDNVDFISSNTCAVLTPRPDVDKDAPWQLPLIETFF